MHFTKYPRLQAVNANEAKHEVMLKIKLYISIFTLALLIAGCHGPKGPTAQETQQQDTAFRVKADRFADIQILRYRIPGFEKLDLQHKKLVYFLYEAALSGRDIIWDQNYKNNLLIRKTIEAVYSTYQGDRSTTEFGQFVTWAKRVWFSNGIHHHYSTKKIIPGFNEEYFHELLSGSDRKALPLKKFGSADELESFLAPILFDPSVDAKRVNKDPDADLILTSANNYYEGVTQKEAEAFYAALKNPDDPTPPMYGLNSQLVKENGKLVEKVWKVGGMYSPAIEKIVYWLEKAHELAENDAQGKALGLLIEYYKTGNLKTFDEYNIAWVKDTASVVDVINGFIEVYGDPLGLKGAYESVVSIKDFEASARMKAVAANAQWFEDNSPILPEHKRKKAGGITYKIITVAVEGGDATPSTPIGINLPNSNWIRSDYGSKSVSLGNIIDAYNDASSGGTVDEFYYREDARERVRKYGKIAGKMHTALHEVIGHASGQLEPGVGTPSETLKNYRSALEEARADLVALYFITDPKLVKLGLLPNTDTGKAEYDNFIKNGLQLQLRRLNPGDDIEESHMRDRQLIARWAYEHGKDDNVIEKIVENGKTYFVINDYDQLRQLFGKLLREVQRIKSQGDYEAGKALVEQYGVKADQNLIIEVKARYEQLDVAPYSGFIQPELVPVIKDGKIVDIRIEYPDDFAGQMMKYGRDYAFLE